mmetsp:Transcript_39174/g.90848  ORF Transcript_39174/g.90848 Transcript_39174/m.90848 type:complete len:223 (+) Transcript_39174:976-1644(+)
MEHQHVMQRRVAPRRRCTHHKRQTKDLSALCPGSAIGAADVHHATVHGLDQKDSRLRLLLGILNAFLPLSGRGVALLVLHQLLWSLENLKRKQLVLSADVRELQGRVQVPVDPTAVDLCQQHRRHGHRQPAAQGPLHALHRAALRHRDGVARERLAFVSSGTREGQWEEHDPQRGTIDVVGRDWHTQVAEGLKGRGGGTTSTARQLGTQLALKHVHYQTPVA